MTGKLIIFSAPSGSGKSTLINYLMGQDLNLAFSISATSRPPRGTERDGVEYFFLTPEEFRQRIANGEFLEYEEVYKDRFYGTLKAQVEKQLEAATQLEGKTMRLLRNKVTDAEIAEVLARWTGIPVSRMMESEREKLLRMEQELHHRVIGQNEAVDAVSNAIRRSRAGLADPNRPIGSFLFLGPTGVGKTELCKALANFMFDSDEAMVRIDMSEFMEKHSVSRLVGAPPGYVGYEEGGYLTEAVRRRPYSVILLDEVEKAHPDVFNILLQVLDDGRLTDGQWRTVDFRNTVVIMTSNLGSDLIQERFGELDYAHMKELVLGVVSHNFRPEFINRIDDIIVFHMLKKEQIGQIVDIMMRTVNNRIMEQMSLSVELDDEAKAYIVDKGYDSKYGARPLRRTIQNEIEDVMAEKILEGSIKAGNKVLVTVKDGKLNFSCKRGHNRNIHK